MKRLLCLLLALFLPACACAKTVVIPSNTVEIEAEAFKGDASITEVEIPAGVLSIGTDAFDGCAPALCLYVKSGSYAEQFANSFGLRYEDTQ